MRILDLGDLPVEVARHKALTQVSRCVYRFVSGNGTNSQNGRSYEVQRMAGQSPKRIIHTRYDRVLSVS